MRCIFCGLQERSCLLPLLQETAKNSWLTLSKIFKISPNNLVRISWQLCYHFVNTSLNGMSIWQQEKIVTDMNIEQDKRRSSGGERAHKVNVRKKSQWRQRQMKGHYCHQKKKSSLAISKVSCVVELTGATLWRWQATEVDFSDGGVETRWWGRWASTGWSF